MKKIITLIAIALLFASCSSSDDFEGTQSDLIGSWKVSTVIVEGIQIDLNECDRKENIVVDSAGKASWNYYITKTEPCSVLINNFIFKSENINFDIEGTSQNTSMYGRFLGSKTIKITKFYRNPDLKTVYTFTK